MIKISKCACRETRSAIFPTVSPVHSLQTSLISSSAVTAPPEKVGIHKKIAISLALQVLQKQSHGWPNELIRYPPHLLTALHGTHLASPYASFLQFGAVKCLWVPFLLCLVCSGSTKHLSWKQQLSVSPQAGNPTSLSSPLIFPKELKAESALPWGCALWNYFRLITVRYEGFLVINRKWVPTVWRLICCLSHLLSE